MLTSNFKHKGMVSTIYQYVFNNSSICYNVQVWLLHCVYKATRSHLYKHNPRYLCEGTPDCGEGNWGIWLVSLKLEPVGSQWNILVTFGQHAFSVHISFTWPCRAAVIQRGGASHTDTSSTCMQHYGMCWDFYDNIQVRSALQWSRAVSVSVAQYTSYNNDISISSFKVHFKRFSSQHVGKTANLLFMLS